MIGILRNRLALGRQTVAWPDGPVGLPERYRGRPVVDPSRCVAGCAACVEACPTAAVRDPGAPSMRVDLGRCLFCGGCEEACAHEAIRFTKDYRLSTCAREELVVGPDVPLRARALDATARRILGRSLRLRQVSAGGCSGCEAELNASSNVQFDSPRFGIQWVASPRHADGIVVTGPLTDHMRRALVDTYQAVPAPKLVVAFGACAISGGPYIGSPVASDGLGGAGSPLAGIPVDLWIAGCPPHPITFLDGLLQLLGRIENGELRVETTGLVR